MTGDGMDTAKRGRGRPRGSYDKAPRVSRAVKPAESTCPDGTWGLQEYLSARADIPAQASTSRSNVSGQISANQFSSKTRSVTGVDETVDPSNQRTQAATSNHPRHHAPFDQPGTKQRRNQVSPYPVRPERREANRLAAERSRNRQAQRAAILETMAKGLTEENVALKSKIMALGLNTIPDEAIMNGDIRPSVNIAVDDSTDLVNISSPARGVPIAKPSSGLPPTFQTEVEQILRQEIRDLRAQLQSSSEREANSRDGSAALQTMDIANLRDVAVRLSKLNGVACRSLNASRQRLLELQIQLDHQSYTHVDNLDALATKRHAQIESGLADMKRHIEKLVTHYNPSAAGFAHALGDSSLSQPHILPQKFEPIPLPEPMKRGRPLKAQLNGEDSGRIVQSNSHT